MSALDALSQRKKLHTIVDEEDTLFQKLLNAPFLNGLFSKEFSRGQTAH